MRIILHFRLFHPRRPVQLGISYLYRRGWPSDTLPCEDTGMPSSHELTIGLLLCRFRVELETTIPNAE